MDVPYWSPEAAYEKFKGSNFHKKEVENQTTDLLCPEIANDAISSCDFMDYSFAEFDISHLSHGNSIKKMRNRAADKLFYVQKTRETGQKVR